MKCFTYDLDQRLVDTLFVAIRDKSDVIRLLMNSVKIMLINAEIADDRKIGQLVLQVDKMSRIFLKSADKFFSVNFPFAVIVDEGRVMFSSKLVDEIDHKVSSEVLAFVNSEQNFSSSNVYEFIDPIVSTEDFSIGFWSLIRELIFFEDGYVRFDHDPARQNGRRHPLNHLDFFYSPGTTFKVGLAARIALDHLVDLVDTGSDCHFLDTGTPR